LNLNITYLQTLCIIYREDCNLNRRYYLVFFFTFVCVSNAFNVLNSGVFPFVMLVSIIQREIIKY
jgi:hypothetical protein